MIEILNNIYLLDNNGIRKGINKHYDQYQLIINKSKPTWKEINKARAILYVIGYLIPEVIALESLEKRVRFIKPKISIDKFLSAIDRKDKNILLKYENNREFNKLKEFYIIIKSVKNKVNKGRLYLDEDIFNKQFNKLKPKNYF